eukprot:1470394-Pleurochrysis_carterae.AAC.3
MSFCDLHGNGSLTLNATTPICWDLAPVISLAREVVFKPPMDRCLFRVSAARPLTHVMLQLQTELRSEYEEIALHPDVVLICYAVRSYNLHDASMIRKSGLCPASGDSSSGPADRRKLTFEK